MNADDADCDVLTTMSQGRIEPRQNCFQKKRGEGEWGELTLKDSQVSYDWRFQPLPIPC